MKLQRLKYPHFYKNRPYVIREEAGKQFVGREMELKMMWDNLYMLLDGRRTNWSMLAQRKMGKTALMKRFFNIMYWEQEQVIPIYYCFKNRENSVVNIADEMVITFLRQWGAFITKNPDWEEIENENLFRNEILSLDEKLQNSFDKTLSIFHEYKRNSTGKNHIRSALAMLQFLVKHFKMPCVFMLDEMQELASGKILDEQGKSIRCEDELFEVIMNPDIWTIGAGSQVSMLAYDVVIDDLANRVDNQKFYPLKQKDSEELARKLLKHYSYKNYKGIETDIYNLVGGNPYYIISLISPSLHYMQQKEEDKKFDTQENLKRAFDFEVYNNTGKIFSFWDKHFDTYHEKLNNDTRDKKGLSYRLLRYIAENKERNIFYDEIVEKFSLDKEEVDRKIQQLERADLLRRETQQEIAGLQDEVLSSVLLRLYYPEIMGKTDPVQMKKDLAMELEKRLGKVEVQVKRQRGEISNIKGVGFEQKVKQAAIKGKLKALNGYKVSGNLRSALYHSGRKSYQIDLVGALESKNGNGNKRSRPGLIVEVKDRKKKVGIAEARKFCEAIKLAKKQEKYTRTIALYISTAGFTTPAKKYLDQHKIQSLQGKEL